MKMVAMTIQKNSISTPISDDSLCFEKLVILTERLLIKPILASVVEKYKLSVRQIPLYILAEKHKFKTGKLAFR